MGVRGLWLLCEVVLMDVMFEFLGINDKKLYVIKEYVEEKLSKVIIKKLKVVF